MKVNYWISKTRYMYKCKAGLMATHSLFDLVFHVFSKQNSRGKIQRGYVMQQDSQTLESVLYIQSL